MGLVHTLHLTLAEAFMGPFRDLLAVDQQGAFDFFLTGLKDVCDPAVDRHELFYNASVLAHYAQTSTQADWEMPAPADLGAVFDNFVIHSEVFYDRVLLETAAAQCLLLTGFYEDQMRGRHNIRWYAELGAGFFSRAAAQQQHANKARLLLLLARHFEPWRQRHARLSRELRDQQYLVTPQPPPESLM
jgi:hypothetical protein